MPSEAIHSVRKYTVGRTEYHAAKFLVAMRVYVESYGIEVFVFATSAKEGVKRTV